ncbi:hypothetical protein [Idiomarina xiamenensis]|uniref:Outer membrane protein beta-barrel domain-containing protein n=1 Tax=Idiomarina xiamenensis 10-D-4 TaxID=740709 RepID=K2KPB6_9GAMM|nr:hypothetical protein [Idiomarina xiamenensis]EKE84214.1 hypothetical protein A10D4_05961 [Idiomarina xiamenensis 10-D-4]
MQKSVWILSTLMSGVLLSPLASAQNADPLPNYTYAGLAIEDNDDFRDADTGFKIDGSYELQQQYFVSGYYRNLDSDGIDSNSDYDSFNVTGGRYFVLQNGFVVDAGVRLGHVDYGDSTNFWGAEANVRKRLGMFEVYGGASWVDYTSAGSDTQYKLGGRAFVTPALAFGVEANDSEFGDALALTAQYNW